MSETSVVGANTVVSGHIRGEGALEVLGRVEGDVDVTGNVRVGPSGRIRGNVSGASLTISGQVQGDLHGRDSVLLERGARVAGDIKSPRIGIAEGALARGHVQTEGEPAAAAEARSASVAARVVLPNKAPAPFAEAKPAGPFRTEPKPPPPSPQKDLKAPLPPAPARPELKPPPPAPARLELKPPPPAPPRIEPRAKAVSPGRSELQVPPPPPAPSVAIPAPRGEPRGPNSNAEPRRPDVARAAAPVEFEPVRPLKPEARRPPPPVVPVISKGTKAKKRKSAD